MKYKKISINFSIPIPVASLRAWSDAKYQWRKFTFRLAPFRCSECGTKMNVKHVQYHHPSGRMIVENAHYGPICRDCIVKHLRENPWKPRFSTLASGWKKMHCDCCGNSKEAFLDVAVSNKVSLMICVRSWNYNNVCANCIFETLQRGTISTSRYGVYKGKMLPYNEKGLYITPQGELV